jgi:hypothetical protein
MVAESLWENVLKESMIDKSIPTKSILLLGNDGIEDIVAALARSDNVEQSDALGYTYFDEMDEDGEGTKR